MTLNNVPPHLQRTRIASFHGSAVINALVTSSFTARGSLENIWPHLTDAERRLIVGASLLTEVGVVMLGETRVWTWTDGEIWVHDKTLADKIITVITGRRT